MNKKGQTTMEVFMLIGIAFALVIILGSFLFFYSTVNDAFQGNIAAGQVNLTSASDDTVGKINQAFFNTSDLIGIFFLFGVILAIMISGFLLRNSTSKIFFVVDFLIVVFAYILAGYISNAYETILTTIPFSDLIISNLGNTSRFVLFLPQITAVVGFITMILTYSGIPRSRDEAEVGGF